MRNLIELLKALSLFVSCLIIGYGGLFLFFYSRGVYMFDYQTGYYDYNYRTLKEAQEAKKQAGKGAKITTFLSTNENMEIITIYKLTFKALF